MKHHALAVVVTGAVLGLPALAAAAVPQASVEQGGAPQALALGSGCFVEPLTTLCADAPSGFPAPALSIDPAAPFRVLLSEDIIAVRVRSGPTGTPVAATIEDPRTVTVVPPTRLFGRLEVSVDPGIGGDANFAGELPPAPVPPPPTQAAPVAAKMTLRAAAGFRLSALRFTARSNTTGRVQVTARIGTIKITRSLTFTKAGPLTFRLHTTAAQNTRLRRALHQGTVVLKATISGNGATATASASATLRK